MSISAALLSTEDWESRLGEQLRAVRIQSGLDQLTLADHAGVSIGAVRNLERGKGSTVHTLVKIARTLGREDWLAGLAPTPTISPIELMRSGPRVRTRVYRPRHSGG